MKVLISAIVMIIIAGILLFTAVDSGKKDVVTMEVFVNNHFSLIQHKNYRKIYETFHEDLQQSISLKEYETAWKERIKEYGSLVSWKIISANKSSNLFSNETEHNVIIHLRFGPKEVIATVRHDWKVEDDSVKLIWTGTARGNTEAY